MLRRDPNRVAGADDAWYFGVAYLDLSSHGLANTSLLALNPCAMAHSFSGVCYSNGCAGGGGNTAAL